MTVDLTLKLRAEHKICQDCHVSLAQTLLERWSRISVALDFKEWPNFVNMQQSVSM